VRGVAREKNMPDSIGGGGALMYVVSGVKCEFVFLVPWQNSPDEFRNSVHDRSQRQRRPLSKCETPQTFEIDFVDDSSPAQFADRIRADLKAWAEVAKAANVTVE
jgi:hypothetical protein